MFNFISNQLLTLSLFYVLMIFNDALHRVAEKLRIFKTNKIFPIKIEFIHK
jgi:hypothetical protein